MSLLFCFRPSATTHQPCCCLAVVCRACCRRVSSATMGYKRRPMPAHKRMRWGSRKCGKCRKRCAGCLRVIWLVGAGGVVCVCGGVPAHKHMHLGSSKCGRSRKRCAGCVGSLCGGWGQGVLGAGCLLTKSSAAGLKEVWEVPALGLTGRGGGCLPAKGTKTLTYNREVSSGEGGAMPARKLTR